MRFWFLLAFILFEKVDLSFLMHFTLWLACCVLVLLAVFAERLCVCLFALVLGIGIVLSFLPWLEVADSREAFDWNSGCCINRVLVRGHGFWVPVFVWLLCLPVTSLCFLHWVICCMLTCSWGSYSESSLSFILSCAMIIPSSPSAACDEGDV